MLDYNKEYDAAKIDTPENRRGMVHLLWKYGPAVNGSIPLFGNPEGGDPTLALCLNIMADYSVPDRDSPEKLEEAMDLWIRNQGNDACFAHFFNRLRRFDLMDVSLNPNKLGWPVFPDVMIGDKKTKVLFLFTRRKWAAMNFAGEYYCHHIGIDAAIDACRREGARYMLLNPNYNNGVLDIDSVQGCLDDYRKIDELLAGIRMNGVACSDLFPLLAQDFLIRNVSCIYDRGKTAEGYCRPYNDGQAPGYNIKTAGGEIVYVSFDSLQSIRSVPRKNK